MSDVVVLNEIFSIRTNDQGRRYLRVRGRKGYPLLMLQGETPEDTVRRYEDRKFERRTAGASNDTFTLDDPPASGGTETPPVEDDVPRKLRPDPLPKPRGGGKVRDKVTTAALERMLAELLAAPAIPAALVLRCSYCAAHFASSSRQTAKELVMLAQQNEPLLHFLERMHDAWATIGYASIIGGYLLKPVIHHAAPYQVRSAVGPFIGVPLNNHDHHHPEFMAQQQAAAQRMQEEQARAHAAATAQPQGTVHPFPQQPPPDPAA